MKKKAIVSLRFLILSSTVHAEQTSMTSSSFSIIDKELYKKGLQKYRENIRSFLTEIFVEKGECL